LSEKPLSAVVVRANRISTLSPLESFFAQHILRALHMNPFLPSSTSDSAVVLHVLFAQQTSNEILAQFLILLTSEAEWVGG
jgi:hypothetical protein